MRFLYTVVCTFFTRKSSLLPVYNVSNRKRYLGRSFLSIASVIALSVSLPQIGFASTCTWKGTTSKAWGTASNWTGGVPTQTSDVIIPLTATNFPTVPSFSTPTLFAHNITILATSGTVIIIPLGFTLSISGSITTSGGLIDARNAIIITPGTAPQSIGGNCFLSSAINILANTNSDLVSGVTISSSLGITGELSLNDYSILTSNGNLVLISNASSTAILSPIDEDPASGAPLASIIGSVTVQRYYQAHRRWRLVTAPIQSSGAPTISAAWQEGGQSIAGSTSNPAPGFGTVISGPAVGAFVSSTGYDQSANNSPSIAYLADANSWFAIPNTNSTSVTAYQGYMLFVRGDRSFPIYTGTVNTLATSTTLRTTGTLNLGRVNIPVNSGFNVLGNPYAATVNFNSISDSNALLSNNTFYLWDPNIGSADNLSTNGTGGWVTLSWDATEGIYDAVPDPTTGPFVHPFDINGDIQSGAAFVVQTSGAGSVVIDESDKSEGNGTDGDLYLFRPAVNTISTLRTTLYSTDTANSYVADGALNEFSSSYTNDVNWNKDVKKIFSFGEALFIQKNGQSLAIEKSALPQAGDTVHLSIGSLKVAAPYQLVIATKNFTRPDIKAFLIDSFTNISTPILLGDTSVAVNFTVTSVPASSNANRFSVVFTAAPPVITAPVVTTTQAPLIKAYPNPVTNGTVNVDLTNLPAGNYKIRIISETGKVMLNETTYHGLNDGAIAIPFGKNISSGIYILEVIDPSGNKTKINLENQ